MDTSQPILVWIDDINLTASKELPPDLKKLSCTLTRVTDSNSCQMAARLFSTSVAGARNKLSGTADASGSGNAFRLIFPLLVNGNVASSTIKDGTMYSGNCCFNC